MFKVNNKATKNVSIVNFEQVNVGWVQVCVCLMNESLNLKISDVIMNITSYGRCVFDCIHWLTNSFRRISGKTFEVSFGKILL